MNKNLKFYTVIWILALAMFNVLIFVTPAEIAGVSKFTNSFWIAYTFVTVAFLGQYVCTFAAFKGDITRLFYNIPLISVSYIGLIAVLIAGSLFMAIPILPDWLAIIVCFGVLAINIIAVMKSASAVNIVAEMDKKIKNKTFFIRSLTVDAETVAAQAATKEMKAIANKIFEEIRYSDPMSDDALASAETQITIKFSEFSDAVSQNDIACAQKLSDELIVLLKNRNSKCKLLK